MNNRVLVSLSFVGLSLLVGCIQEPGDKTQGPPSLQQTLPVATSTPTTNVPSQPSPPLQQTLPVATNTPATNAPTKISPSFSQPALYFYDTGVGFYGYVSLDGKQISARLGFDSPRFAHYADRLWRLTWDEPPEMWISDLALHSNLKVSEDSLPPCSTSWWYWSPDDLHLICDAEDDSKLGSIYHLQTGIWESWLYVCDRVAVSPATERLALWCRSVVEPASFAIVEWGGEVWISPKAPASMLVQTSSQIPHSEWLWGWSAEGRKVAYFDTDGYLTIASAQGTLLRTLPGARDSVNKPDPKLWESRVEWSADGRRILVLARGGTTKPCPSMSESGGENSSCWQVIDALTGEIIWHTSDFIDQMTDKEAVRFLNASISEDGRYLALTYWDLNGIIVIIDLNDGSFWYVQGNLFGDFMHWGELPVGK